MDYVKKNEPRFVQLGKYWSKKYLDHQIYAHYSIKTLSRDDVKLFLTSVLAKRVSGNVPNRTIGNEKYWKDFYSSADRAIILGTRWCDMWEDLNTESIKLKSAFIL